MWFDYTWCVELSLCLHVYLFVCYKWLNGICKRHRHFCLVIINLLPVCFCVRPFLSPVLFGSYYFASHLINFKFEYKHWVRVHVRVCVFVYIYSAVSTLFDYLILPFFSLSASLYSISSMYCLWAIRSGGNSIDSTHAVFAHTHNFIPYSCNNFYFIADPALYRFKREIFVLPIFAFVNCHFFFSFFNSCVFILCKR